MTLKKLIIDKVIPGLFILFIIAYLYSPRVKSWVIMGLMMLGFFKPGIPQLKPGEKSQAMPALQVHSINGRALDLQQQKGKVVFVNFWATWCPPCLAELPSVNALYQKVKSNPNIVFVTIDVDNDLQKSSQFLQKNGYTLPLYGGDVHNTLEQLHDDGIPTTLVIDKQGKVVFNHLNRANYDDATFEQFLNNLGKQ